MALSVIVTSYDSLETLRRCLKSLTAQEEATEIVVSDCSPADPKEELQHLFPSVRFLHFERPRSVPELRWSALPATSGDVVAAVEARCVPSAEWCATLLQAHRDAELSPAAGGPVSLIESSSTFDWAVYLCEYGAFAPPVTIGSSFALSGANLSYKRAALAACSDMTSRGDWETLIHQRWLQEGLQLTMCAAAVKFVNSMTPRTALRQRWWYGRGYAADRIRTESLLRRAGWAAATLALPTLMLLRIGRVAGERGMLPRFIRSFGWVTILCVAWSAGEMMGYCTGTSDRTKIF